MIPASVLSLSHHALRPRGVRGVVGGAREWQVGELRASRVGEWYWVRSWEVFRVLLFLEMPVERRERQG